jgi:hypothetical protein
MKQVTLGVYCVAHLDLPIMVSNDLDITKLDKNQLNDLISNGKIKFANDSHQNLMNGFDVDESAAECFESSVYCGSFKLSKINYIMDDIDVINFLKK